MTVFQAIFAQDRATLVIDGIEVGISEKETLADEGIAVLTPVEEEQGMPEGLGAMRNKGDGYTEWFDTGTQNSVVVVLARRWLLARDTPDFAWGPQPIPTLEEAIAELKSPPGNWSTPDYMEGE